MTVDPSGEQFEITAGAHRATIVEVGDGAHGAPLIPWPNRLADGRYSFEGADHQVPLTEPEKNNAIHGFLRWRNWRAAERDADRVVMATRLHPLKGYPSTCGSSTPSARAGSPWPPPPPTWATKRIPTAAGSTPTCPRAPV